MKLGKNIAKIVDYGITTTRAGALQVFVRLDIEDSGLQTWYGMPFKKDGTLNGMCLQQLANCGFDASEHEIQELDAGVDSGLMDVDSFIDVYATKQTKPDGSEFVGINSLGEIGPMRADSEVIKTLITPEQSAMLKAAGAKFKPRKKSLGAVKPVPAQVNPNPATEDEVPF